MKIIIDLLLTPDGRIAGRHEFDTDATLQHPELPEQTISAIDYIAWLNADSLRRTQAGWHHISHLHDEIKPQSRWQRLLTHTMSDEGDPRLKVLNLEKDNPNHENVLAQAVVGRGSISVDGAPVVDGAASGGASESNAGGSGETVAGDSFWTD